MLLVGLVLCPPTTASAAGLPLDATLRAARALITFDGARQEITLAYALDGAGPQPRLLLPVPPGAEVKALEAAPFAVPDQLTVPRREQKTVGWLGPTPTPAPDLADLPIDRVPSGGLADRLDGPLLAALNMPAAAQPLIQNYQQRGWGLLLLTPPAGSTTGMVRVSFPTSEIVYPLELQRLGDAPLALRLDVVAPYRVAAAGLETFAATPLDPALLRATGISVLPDQAYLTTFRATLAPARIAGDLRLPRAASDAPVAPVITETVYVDGWPNVYGPLFAVAILGVVQVLAFVIGFAVYRRLLKIGKIRD